MILCQPVRCRRLQEASHFSSGMHEIAASPLAVSHVLIRILIQSRTVIIPQRISIHRKMHRHKIHQHTDFMLVTGIDKVPQIIRCSITGSRCKKSGILIAPGFIAGMLAQRHQFHIIVAIFIQIWDQQICHLAISVPSGRIFIVFLSPGTKMNLINI